MRDYLDGISLSGHSPLPPEECARRINAATASLVNPFPSAPVGGVLRGRLRLWRRRSPFDYNAKPVLTGKLLPESGGTRFELRYGAPASAYASYACMALFLIFLLFVGLVIGQPAPGISHAEFFLIILGFGCGMAALIWLMHRMFTFGAMEELDEMLLFLSEHTQAKPSPRSDEAP